MKMLSLAPLLLSLAAPGALRAAPLPAARTEVVFAHPDTYTDVKDSEFGTDKGRDAILARLKSFIIDHATPLLPPGETLTMTFTDVDLAGDYEPWRSGQWSDVRIVKDIYPPAFKFTYSVTDPSGKVVSQGAEDIRDLSFTFRFSPDTTDSLHFEKSFLDDWIHSNLRHLK
jgi:Protein of unknown function (DUF3016)